MTSEELSADFKFIFSKYDSLINYILIKLKEANEKITALLNKPGGEGGEWTPEMEDKLTENVKNQLLESPELAKLIATGGVSQEQLVTNLTEDEKFKSTIKSWISMVGGGGFDLDLDDYLQNNYGDVILELPYKMKFDRLLTDKSCVSVKLFAKFKGVQKFAINFYDSDGHIQFHFSPRYSNKVIIRNSFVKGWQTAVLDMTDITFPYLTDKRYYVTQFYFLADKIHVRVNDAFCLEFMYRNGKTPKDFSKIDVQGDVTLAGIMVK